MMLTIDIAGMARVKTVTETVPHLMVIFCAKGCFTNVSR